MRAERHGVIVSLVLLAMLMAPLPVMAGQPAGAREAVIVVFTDDVANPGAAAAELGRRHGFAARHVYEHALKGFAASVPSAAVAGLSHDPRVAWVEADGMAYPIVDQANATWGLDRIDQRSLPLNSMYHYDATGTGVTAYVIDSGIRTSHEDFGGGASVGADFVGDGQNGQDCNGHGTHVAGTIGGTTYGVAKAVELVSVRVFGCSGGSSWSTIIAGVDWVTANAEKPAVANMSLGGGGNTSVDTAVRNSIASGVSYAIAAGNGNFIGRQDNACKYSPARVAEAMTVSATDSSDRKASWANYGNCVDWFAPGVSITSAWIDSDTDTNTISGTSMATPHTAGVAALYLQANPGASPATVRDDIYEATTKGIVTSSSTANNHLLYSLVTDGGGDPPANNPPVATDDSATTDAGVAVTIDVLANDTDADGNALSVTNLTQPNNGEVAVDGNQVTYTPDAGFVGDDLFTYTANDGTADSNVVTVTVTVVEGAGGGGDEPTSVTVAGLSGSSTNQGRTWTAFVTITISDNLGNPIEGATATGSWSNGATGSASCTTNAAGQCQVDKTDIRKNIGSVTFTVTNLTGTTLPWDGVPQSVNVLKP